MPHDSAGFVGTDEHCRVIGMERVYACGDVTAFPVKQGGIAAQQADVAAEAIAAELGAPVEPEPFDPILRGTLWTGGKPKFLYGRLSGGHGETSVLADHAVWENEGKIVGRYLAPFLDSVPGVERPASQSGSGDGASPSSPAASPVSSPGGRRSGISWCRMKAIELMPASETVDDAVCS